MRLLIIGSMTHSLATYDDGARERFGGGVSYGGQAAAALGIPATIITIGAKDIEPGMKKLKSLGLDVRRISRNSSNNFSNDYRGGRRALQMRSFVKEPISKDDLKQIPECDAVIFFPGLHEISPEILDIFKNRLVFLDVGGLTRELGPKNKEGLWPVSQGRWENIDDFRNKVDILKVSEEDLENTGEKIQDLAENGFPAVLLTRGEKSTILAQKGKAQVEIPVQPIKNGDTAGAGEVFSVGFICEYLLTKDPVMAAAFGNACAWLKVAGKTYDYQKAKERLRREN